MSIDSNDVVSLNWIGVFFDRLQLADSANYYFQKTIKKEKTHFEDSIWAYRNGISWSFSNLAETFLTSKDYNMANAYFKKAIEYDSENPERYFYKGCFNYRYLKNNLQALDDFGICIKLDPKNPEWYANRSMVHQIDGNVKLAKEDLDKAISLSTNHPAYIAKRGNFYTQIKAFEKAEKDISYALKIDSTNPKIYHYQILLLKDQNLIDEAISVGRKAISKFTNDTTANFLLGQIYLERKDYFKAIMHFNEAISIMKFNYSQQTIEPDYFPIFLSDCYLKLGDIYDILNEKDLKCENYQSANLAIQEETRPDKIELEKLILEKMSLCVE
jgi:tetratricopeptide (TPR) repeat protein